jgi:pyruvate ferredoxin oxidoreductase beta subunit
VSRLKTMVRNENGVPPLRGGHSLCQGCGIPMVVRTIVDSIETPVVVVSATGCLEVATTRFPTTAWNVPWLHVAFENSAAVASGVESAYRALARRGALPQEDPITFVVLAGDGGTYDIGLQALSGALERGHRFLFVCYDNEAYMNTGVQRSGATPFGANTTTSPAGTASLGKAQQRKDMTAIAVAHHVPYVGQGASSHWQDLSEKVVRAARADGPAFLNVLTDCPVGWGHEPRLSPRIVNTAVDSCFWPLYEVVDGRYRLTYVPDQVVLIEEWLRLQTRFAHLLKPGAEALVTEIQKSVDDDWAALLARCEADADSGATRSIRTSPHPGSVAAPMAPEGAGARIRT